MFLADTQLEKHTHSVGLLWESEQPVTHAATCTPQIQQTIIDAVTRIRTRYPNNRRAADLGLDLIPPGSISLSFIGVVCQKLFPELLEQ